jgi:hypothetical protein
MIQPSLFDIDYQCRICSRIVRAVRYWCYEVGKGRARRMVSDGPYCLDCYKEKVC